MTLKVDLDRALERALRRYAEEGGRTFTGITRLALRRLIPRRFFEDEDEDQQQPDTAA